MERLQWMQPVLAGIFQILSHTHRSQVRKVQKLGIRDPIETTPFGRNQRESSWDWMCLNRSIDSFHIERVQEIPRGLSKSNPIVHGRTRNHRSSFHLHKSNPDFRDRPMDRNRQSKTQKSAIGSQNQPGSTRVGQSQSEPVRVSWSQAESGKVSRVSQGMPE